MFCKEFKCIGFDCHGGDADYIAVPAENCMRIPDDMSFVTAAVSTDAVGTLFHAQKRIDISGRDILVIYGMGPMGCAGVMIAKALGATVIAVHMLDSRLEMAKELGSDYALNGKKVNVQEEIARITKGRGVDAAMDCSGSPYAENDALDWLDRVVVWLLSVKARKVPLNQANNLFANKFRLSVHGISQFKSLMKYLSSL